MRIQLTQLTVGLDYGERELRLATAGRLKIPAEAVLSCNVVRRSVDARGRHRRVCFSVNVEAEIEASAAETLRDKKGVTILAEPAGDVPAFPAFSAFLGKYPPVVVGAGPAGLLAAWRLAQAGAKPILIERGAPVEKRRAAAARFWSDGTLDPEDNVLYGEGGAGLFSDGKLTTRSKRRDHLRTVLELLVRCGAPESILIDAEPHVGSDRLAAVVRALREQLVAMGAQVRFHARLDGLELDHGCLAAVVVDGQPIPARHCVLATGHSAGDVYEMLQRTRIPLSPKAFAVGVRLEAPQRQIDRSQYGEYVGHRRLGPASFRLTRRQNAGARACYTFCMCPGGSVIACASADGRLTTNGMSLSDRSGPYGNAAFLVPVDPEDYGSGDGDPLAGLRWRRAVEAGAFDAGGGGFVLPACRLTDFLAASEPADLPQGRSCQRAAPADLHRILPPHVSDTLTRAIGPMMRKLSKVRLDTVVVYGVETRSSSPVRIVRDESLQSPAARGLYPVGEGSGYAGGIITSAIDGLRAAEAVLQPETQAQ